MSRLSVKTVGVVGTGVIGSSWTALFLARGLWVLVSDPAPGAQETLSNYLNTVWPTLKQLGLSDGASISNYTFVVSSLTEHFHELDFVQENAPERVELKSELIAEIDAGTRENVIIASSSSGLPSSQFIHKCTKNSAQILIGHPFNPPHLMPLVEVVPHPRTSKDTISQAMDMYKYLGKAPVVIRREIPGFATNRLQVALLQEVFSLVQRGIVSAADVDTCITTSLGPRWATIGPYMSKVLAGGFKHSLSHLGPAEQMWIEDMREHEFQLNDENVDILNDSVGEMLKKMDVNEVQSPWGMDSIANSLGNIFLPVEIRLYIYELLMTIPNDDDLGLRLTQANTLLHSSVLSILLVCRQTHSEAEDIFYSVNRLSISHLESVLPTLDVTRREAITRLTVPVARAENAFAAAQNVLNALPNLRSLYLLRTLSIRFVMPSTWAIFAKQTADAVARHSKLEDVRFITPEANSMTADEEKRLVRLKEIDQTIETATTSVRNV